jgi:hypothetical protein
MAHSGKVRLRGAVEPLSVCLPRFYRGAVLGSF